MRDPFKKLKQKQKQKQTKIKNKNKDKNKTNQNKNIIIKDSENLFFCFKKMYLLATG